MVMNIGLSLPVPDVSSSLKASIAGDTSATSFTQQLELAIEGYLGNIQGNQVMIDVAPSAAPQSGLQQFVVTVTSGDSTASESTGKATAGAPLTSTQPSTTTDAGPATPAPGTPITDEADAYWAEQPPEVQQLRTMGDLGARIEKGRELAQEGYAIDYDIMVWHQDPYMTMHIREGEGYTWVPGMGQPPLTSSAPGLSFPGMAGYNNEPIVGAIKVSTDFAKGLEQTSPWYS